MLLMLVLTVLLLLRLHEARGWALSLPFLAFWLSLYPPGLFFSLQYGAIYCVTVLGCLGVLRAGEERRILLFEMIGTAASYFDLMTYPLVSLGVPLALWMCLSAGEEKQLINRTGQALGLCLCWGFGYTFTWVFKWLLAGLLTGSDAIAESLSVAAFRISGQMGPEHIGPLSAITRNISVFAYKGLLLGLLLLFAAMLWLLRRRGRQSRCMSDTLGLLGCALMPFIWYALLSNHSHIHAFFTYRELSITVFALFALLMLPLKGQLPPGNNQSIAK